MVSIGINLMKHRYLQLVDFTTVLLSHHRLTDLVAAYKMCTVLEMATGGSSTDRNNRIEKSDGPHTNGENPLKLHVWGCMETRVSTSTRKHLNPSLLHI